VFLLAFGVEVDAVVLLLLVLVVILDEGDDVDEVGVVGVDVAQLDLYEVFDHLLRFVQRLQ